MSARKLLPPDGLSVSELKVWNDLVARARKEKRVIDPASAPALETLARASVVMAELSADLRNGDAKRFSQVCAQVRALTAHLFPPARKTAQPKASAKADGLYMRN